MITPTKTVCFALWVNSDEWYRVYECDDIGVRTDSGWWTYGNFDRFVVREESEFLRRLSFMSSMAKSIEKKLTIDWKDERFADWLGVENSEFYS